MDKQFRERDEYLSAIAKKYARSGQYKPLEFHKKTSYLHSMEQLKTSAKNKRLEMEELVELENQSQKIFEEFLQGD